MAKVVYWSQTGNTQTMAEAVAKGITAAGGSAECVAVSDITPQDLAGEAVFALGCPAMGAEVLEESEMEPFVEELEKSVSGKKIGLFGSYGWGDGQWMRDWEERMKAAGAEIVGGEGVICMEAPDDKEYLSFRNLIKTGSIFGMDLMFNKIPNELYPYDYETFNKSKSKFTVVATNCETGEAEYFQLKDMKKDIMYLQASCSIPMFANIVKVDGYKLVDGGVSDSI